MTSHTPYSTTDWYDLASSYAWNPMLTSGSFSRQIECLLIIVVGRDIGRERRNHVYVQDINGHNTRARRRVSE